MILQALVKYYDRLAVDGEIAEEGFQTKGIPFVIVLREDGRFLDLEDTRTIDGKRKRSRDFMVPREVKRAGPGAWQRANLLWDNAAYVLGFPETADSERKHRVFLELITTTFAGLTDPGVTAALAFLGAADFAGLTAHPLWKEILENKGNISFRLADDTCLLPERPSIKRHILMGLSAKSNTATQACLLTGSRDEPALLNAAIKGVIGTNTSGANIVSFNLKAFESYGKEQGLNAPIGKRAEFAYTTALNTLLRDNDHRLRVGDATAVFWAEKENKFESVFESLFGFASSTGEIPEVSVQELKRVAALFKAPASGIKPEEDPFTRFFVLGLAPNAARIAIRFWYAGSVGEVADHINQHFDDIAIVRPPTQPEYLSLFRLLVSTATQSKAENIPPNLAGEFMKTILDGTPYPRSMLSAAVTRCRAEHDVPYPRAALIKAVLARQTRFHHPSEKEVGMALDMLNTNIGYRLGRLFAVLEKAQEEASPGINATIRDRFYGSASSTPVVAFPHLLKLKNHHLSKLESRGRAVNLEKLIGEIMDGISDFPPHIRLEDQGRFAVGYYHQRQDFFKKNETPKTA